MKSDFSLTEGALTYLRRLVKIKLREEPSTVICLGWGRWENSGMQIMVGIYPDPNYPKSPPVYDFSGLWVSFAFPVNTMGIPLNGVITFDGDKLVFLDNHCGSGLNAIQGLLISDSV